MAQSTGEIRSVAVRRLWHRPAAAMLSLALAAAGGYAVGKDSLSAPKQSIAVAYPIRDPNLTSVFDAGRYYCSPPPAKGVTVNNALPVQTARYVDMFRYNTANDVEEELAPGTNLCAVGVLFEETAAPHSGLLVDRVLVIDQQTKKFGEVALYQDGRASFVGSVPELCSELGAAGWCG